MSQQQDDFQQEQQQPVRVKKPLAAYFCFMESMRSTVKAEMPGMSCG